MVSQLEHLRTLSSIDCDTLDVTVAQALGPFVDCTSNQAIALAELSKPENADLIANAWVLARSLPNTHINNSLNLSNGGLTGLVASCLLSARILPHLTGYVHTQTNPYFAWETEEMVREARLIIDIYSAMEPPVPKERVCIKIPATWPGLQACRKLEGEGIHTLATTLFTMAQAKEAARAGCTYIAPYINRLRVHFEKGYVDENPGFDVAVEAQRLYEVNGYKTQVLAASFIAPAEVLRLSGLKHLTISPPLLSQLAETPHAEGEAGGVVGAPRGVPMDEGPVSEVEWKLEFSAEGSGNGYVRLMEALGIFRDEQEKLQALCLAIM
jgi:transaldolase